MSRVLGLDFIASRGSRNRAIKPRSSRGRAIATRTHRPPPRNIKKTRNTGGHVLTAGRGRFCYVAVSSDSVSFLCSASSSKALSTFGRHLPLIQSWTRLRCTPIFFASAVTPPAAFAVSRAIFFQSFFNSPPCSNLFAVVCFCLHLRKCRNGALLRCFWRFWCSKKFALCAPIYVCYANRCNLYADVNTL